MLQYGRTAAFTTPRLPARTACTLWSTVQCGLPTDPICRKTRLSRCGCGRTASPTCWPVLILIYPRQLSPQRGAVSCGSIPPTTRASTSLYTPSGSVSRLLSAEGLVLEG